MAAQATSHSGAFERRFANALAKLPIADLSTRRICVAFSGGLDSTLLLNALHRYGGLRLSAIHVDHRLQPESGQWSRHCIEQARALGIACATGSLDLRPVPGQSLEALAREARYAALADRLADGDVLVTAHHADDQLETVLLRLLRGTGVRGLTAIHDCAPFGRGLLARPLLPFSRAEIEAQARAWQLEWLEDPSNADLRFDRNFLRQSVLPQLRARWPQAGPLASRLAQQMAEAQSVLDDVAGSDLAAAADPECIPLSLLRGLSPARQHNAVRHATRMLALPVPSAAQLAELVQSFAARADAEAVVTWPGAEARIYRDHLYLMPPAAGRAAVAATGPSAQSGMQIDTRSMWSGSQGRLRLVAADSYGIPQRWAEAGLTIAFRSGGERFRPRGCRHHKTLKHWFQEQGIVPWVRDDVPLLFHEGHLVAVADLCLSADLPQSPGDAPFWRPEWTGHARLH